MANWPGVAQNGRMNPTPLLLKILFVGSELGPRRQRDLDTLGWPSTVCPWQAWLDHRSPPGPWDATLVDMTDEPTAEDWLSLHHMVPWVSSPLVLLVDGPVPFSFHYPRAGGLRVGPLPADASVDVIRSTVNLVRQVYLLVRRQPDTATETGAAPLDPEQRALLVDSVRRIRQDFQTVESLLDPSERAGARVQPLRGREQEVYALVMRGLSLQAIAQRLTIAESTVKKHVHAIYRKRGVSSRAELMASG